MSKDKAKGFDWSVFNGHTGVAEWIVGELQKHTPAERATQADEWLQRNSVLLEQQILADQQDAEDNNAMWTANCVAPRIAAMARQYYALAVAEDIAAMAAGPKKEGG